MGAVHRITAPDFVDSGVAFTGAATLSVYPAAGSQIDAPYGGTSGPSFDLKNVPLGNAWVAVKDESMSGVWSTVSSLSVPQLSSVAVPVVDQMLLTTVTNALPSVKAKGLKTTLAHVVLFVQHGGMPYKGVKATAGTGGALVAYDTGPGTYSDTATATGAAGVVLLFNTSLSGIAMVTIADPALQKSWQVSLLSGAGFVTLTSADLE
jgi:hypothetical protein